MGDGTAIHAGVSSSLLIGAQKSLFSQLDLRYIPNDEIMLQV